MLASVGPGWFCAWAEAVALTLPSPSDWSLETLSTRDAHGRHSALMSALQECHQAALGVSGEISRHLFSHVGPADRTVWQ